MPNTVGYDPHMSQELYLQPWCQYRHLSLSEIAEQSTLDLNTLEAVQNGSVDPTVSLLNTIAKHLQIPTSWLHYHPLTIQRLWNDLDDDQPELPIDHAVDPIFERMIQARRDYPDLFTLLTNLIHHDDPKLIRAAHVNLQSLSKQIRTTTVPWGSRPPGHFEPPSD